MLKIKLVDNKKNELIKFKVEIDKHAFIVVCETNDDRYEYIKTRIHQIRKEEMITYLNYIEYDKTEQGAKDLENKIMMKAEEILEDEIKKIYEEQGIMLYIEKEYNNIIKDMKITKVNIGLLDNISKFDLKKYLGNINK